MALILCPCTSAPALKHTHTFLASLIGVRQFTTAERRSQYFDERMLLTEYCRLYPDYIVLYGEKKFLYTAALLSFGVIGAMKYGLVTINHGHRNGEFRSSVMEKNLFHYSLGQLYSAWKHF